MMGNLRKEIFIPQLKTFILIKEIYIMWKSKK